MRVDHSNRSTKAAILMLAAAAIATDVNTAYSADGAARRAADAQERRLASSAHQGRQRALWTAERPHSRHLDGRPLELATA